MATAEKADLSPRRESGEDWQGVSEETLTPEDEKRLLRKIDISLLPVMSVIYLFQFLDKTAIQSTAILGLREDLNLTGQQFSWSGAIYYFGYLMASYPASWLMVRWKVGKTLTSAIIVWGASVMLAAAAFNAAGLLTSRFFLGVAEAPIAPGLTIVVSMWYKRSEQPLRHAAWFLGNSIAGIFGGILAYAIGHVKTVAPWKAVFAIYGGATVLWGILTLWLLPDTPMTAWFLNKSDREKAVTRVRENLTGIKSDEFKWPQFWEAITDVKTWLLFFIQLGCNIPNGGISTFKSIIIHGFGYSTSHTLLLTSVAYVLQIFLVLLATGGSTLWHNTRTYWMMWNCCIAIAGASMVYALPQEQIWARFAGITLSGAYAANFPLMMSLLSGNVGGFTKKATVSAITFVGFCAGNIIGPQIFFPWEAPRYTSAFLGMMTCLSINVVLALTMRLYLIWENRRRDRLAAGEPADTGVAQTDAELNMSDQTDKEMLRFRYVY